LQSAKDHSNKSRENAEIGQWRGKKIPKEIGGKGTAGGSIFNMIPRLEVWSEMVMGEEEEGEVLGKNRGTLF